MHFPKTLGPVLLVLIICCFASQEAYSQRWKKKKPETIYVRNKKKNLTPIFVGIGTKNPSTQFHTTGTVRFQGLATNDTLSRFVAADADGNLFFRRFTNLGSNFWSVNGNSNTTPLSNFLGTIDAQPLVVRTNNLERMRILANGSIGVNTTNPTWQFEISSDIEDNQLRVNGAAPSINFFNQELGENTFGRIGLATVNNNFTQGTLPGDFIVQSLGADASLIFGTTGGGTGNGVERARFNSTGYFGISTMSPTAKFHVNCSPVANETNPSNIRFENLQAGTGNSLVIDANGYVFAGTAGNPSNAWNLTGNAGTNPTNNFLGTTDNIALSLRTNNLARVSILGNGSVGVNTANPNSQFEVSSQTPDRHLMASGVSPSLIFFNSTLGNNVAGKIGFATVNNNFTQGSVPGDMVVQTLGASSSLIFGTTGGGTGNGVERARFNSTGYFGISTLSPTAKFHVNCSPVANETNPSNIRFENLQAGTGNSLVIDANGYVFAGTAGNPSNAWNLAGNAGTNPANNFLGTTDNIALSLRTNNLARVSILGDGSVGVNTANPNSQFEVSSQTPDRHLMVSGVSPSLLFFNSTLGNNVAGKIGFATVNNNFTQGSVPGDMVVQTLGASSSLIFGTTGGGLGNGVERARINAVGYFGISTMAPSAKLHVNCTLVAGQTNPSNVRLENLQTGNGSAIVIDANGFVFKSPTLAGKEAEDLKTEVQSLREEVATLRELVNSMKTAGLNTQPNSSSATLFQNTPNPFDRSTTIQYSIPRTGQKAVLQITNMEGRIVKTYALQNGDKQSLTLGSGDLNAGSYFYTLIVDGKKIDSKKMVFGK